MSLKLSSNDTPPYSYFSSGTEATPITVSVTLDNTGGTVTSSEVTIYAVATTYNYTSITMTCVNEVDTGIDWEISLTSGSGFANSIAPGDMDASSADVTTPIYVRATFVNDGSLATGDYTAANINLSGTES